MKPEYVYPSRSVHITQKDLGKRPVLRVTKNSKPVGVSFAPSVKKALNAVPFYYNRLGTEKVRSKDWKERKKYVKEGDTWNVYTPARKRRAVIPKTIDDFHRTGERRVLGKVRAKKIGTVKVSIKRNNWDYEWL